MPTGAEYLWAHFIELHNTRGGGMGPAPISYSEIQAYVSMTGIYLEPWEIDCIKAMDRAFMKVEGDKQKRQQNKARKK